jgi:hypothetical protein
MRVRALFAAVLCVFGIQSLHSASFQNLDFEQYRPADAYLPGWTVFFEGGGLTVPSAGSTNIELNRFPPKVPFATVVSSTYAKEGIPDPGKYALYFSTAEWTVRQQGEIPKSARFIRWETYGVGDAQLRLDGQTIPIAHIPAVRQGPYQGFVEANVSAFAGKNVLLSITTAPPPPGFGPPGFPAFSIVDNITFSPNSVLERLDITLSGTQLVLSWPTAATGFSLEWSSTLGSSATWQPVRASVVVVGDRNTVKVTVSQTPQFFRLSKQ